MLRATCRIQYIGEVVGCCSGLIAVTLLILTLCPPVLACDIDYVWLSPGKDQAEADYLIYLYKTMYICPGSKGYFKGLCFGVDNPTCKPLEWYWDVDGLSGYEEDSTTPCTELYDTYPSPDGYYTYNIEKSYYPKLGVKVKDVTMSWASDTCKIKVVSGNTLILEDGIDHCSVYTSDSSTPNLRVTTSNNGGCVKFWICADSGSYPWKIKEGAIVVASGTLSSPDYKDDEYLPPGKYTLEVEKTGEPSFLRKINFTVFGCDITFTDVCQDKIDVVLDDPDSSSGTFKLRIWGPYVEHTVCEETRASGSYNETFDVMNLPVGYYMFVKATWTIGGCTSSDNFHSYEMRVLGNYLNTCYNTPDESGCSGSLQTYYYVVGSPSNPCQVVSSCNWLSRQGKSGWIDAIFNKDYGTGNGMDTSGNVYSREWYCSGSYSYKLRRTGCACAQCGGCMTLPPANEVAIRHSGHPYLDCDDEVCVFGEGEYKVRDTGKLDEAQLDHYYGVSGCGSCPSIGTRRVIKLKNFP